MSRHFGLTFKFEGYGDNIYPDCTALCVPEFKITYWINKIIQSGRKLIFKTESANSQPIWIIQNDTIG